MRRHFFTGLVWMGYLLCVPYVVQAQGKQNTVQINFAGNEGRQASVEAVITMPDKPGPEKRAAVVILHHAGGWSSGTTNQYAKFLASEGFITLEPRMFNTDGERENTFDHIPTVFGSLSYLAGREDVDPKKISVMGLSYGAVLSLLSGSSWAYRTYAKGELRYAAIAAFYPLCWPAKAYIDRKIGRWKNKAYPETLYDQWAGIPLAIFAPGKDGYESMDPKSCTDLVASIPDEKQKSMSKVYLYPDATHGWDHGKTFTFFARTACKGTGCNNTNVFSPEITEKAKADLREFLRAATGF